MKICTKCIYDERVDSILFNEKGVCNFCTQFEELKKTFGTGIVKGQKKIDNILRLIKKKSKNEKYDCIIGVSGGTDSSFLIHWAKIQGLRPLAVHYDNTWNSAIATQNIKRVLQKANVDLYTHVLNNKESDDIFRSFFLAGVAEIDCPTDLGYAFVLRQVAKKFKIRYILEGHSFVEEGITPLGKNYFDGKYIKSIHKKYGTQPMRTYPLMTFFKFLKSVLIDKPRFIRPFWYIPYSKENAKKILSKQYGWQYYGGHHLENRMTAFYHSIYLPQKFHTDLRINTLAARVRNGTMERAKALAEYNSPLKVEQHLLEYFLKRMEISQERYNSIMKTAPKKWYNFPTYKHHFERLKPLFAVLAKAELVPMSFYLKYCFRQK